MSLGEWENFNDGGDGDGAEELGLSAQELVNISFFFLLMLSLSCF